MTTFGARLKAHRKEAGWTTQQVGKAVYVDQSMISLLESGKRSPSVQVLALLADLYGVSLDELWRGVP
jgi:transcriptional regulator with XRE-family HTH domain